MLESMIESDTNQTEYRHTHNAEKASCVIDRLPFASWTLICEATMATVPHPKIWNKPTNHGQVQHCSQASQELRMQSLVVLRNFEPTKTASIVTGMTFGMKLIAIRETEAIATIRNSGHSHVFPSR